MGRGLVRKGGTDGLASKVWRKCRHGDVQHTEIIMMRGVPVAGTIMFFTRLPVMTGLIKKISIGVFFFRMC